MKTKIVTVVAFITIIAFTASAQTRDTTSKPIKKTNMAANKTKMGTTSKSTSLSPAATGSTPSSNDIHVKTTKASTANVPATAPATPPQQTIPPGKKDRSKTGDKKKTMAAKNKRTTDKTVKDQ